MPSTFSFALLSGGVSGSLGAPVVPVFPVGGSLLACDVLLLTQQHFLDLFDRIFPLEYLDPMKRNLDAGYGVYQAYAAIGERVALAMQRLSCGSFIMFAEGGVRALVEVSFQRPTADAGAGIVKAGTVVRTSRGHRRFILKEDVAFQALDLGPLTGMAEAEAVGAEYNVAGVVITPSGITLEGEIDEVDVWLQDPPFWDQTLTVQQLNPPLVEGSCAYLDGLGSNRGVERVPAETDAQYRLRIRSLPDVVSPAAIQRAVERRLAGARVALPFDICEVFERSYQFVYDAPDGTPFSEVFVYDDPRPVSFVTDFCRNRLMDEVEMRGAFVVVVPNNVTLVDVGMAYDDTGSTPADFLQSGTGVRRGTPAYDILADDNVLVMTAAYDGFDLERGALYAALQAELNAIKPVGVAAIIETIRP